MRKLTKEIKIGSVTIGGNNKIAIQSMTNTKTKDVLGTLTQIEELKKAGCDIIRLAVLDETDALALHEIVKKANANLVADIHFDYKLALIAIDAGINKLRINPGNIGSIEGIKKIVAKCKEKHIPIRIGVNSGSINKDIKEKYGTTARALVESAKEHIKILEDLDFYDIVVSIKASDVLKTIEAYKLFSSEYDYPVHIGLTEAGTLLNGSIKSSICLSNLLLSGIGDTIRVSLTDDPVKEVLIAKEILSSINMLDKPVLVSCPTCGRCQYNMIPIANEINEFLYRFDKKIKVAIMGCIVNGPGEAMDADIGIAGGKNCCVLFKKGIVSHKIKEENIINYLKNEIVLYINNYKVIYNDKLTDDIKSLRENVFIKEKNFNNEFDEYDNISKYVSIYNNNEIIATSRYYIKDDNYYIGRICVKDNYRNNRLGSILLMLIENNIEDGKTIYISSQKDKTSFYEKNNYIKLDKEYLDENYPHILMSKIK